MPHAPGCSKLEALSREVAACRRCPRLVAYREHVATTKRRAYLQEEYWGRPVPGFGDPGARILLIGLAPAAHGANRTGRMFTGDRSGDWLYRALFKAGLASQPHSVRPGDGLRLRGAYIGAAVRCAPPENLPSRVELEACRSFLLAELELLPHIQVVLGLGKIGFETALRALVERGAALPSPRPRFRHGAVVKLGPRHPVVVGSFHPSQQNTQTGRLTEPMLDAAMALAISLARRGD